MSDTYLVRPERGHAKEVRQSLSELEIDPKVLKSAKLFIIHVDDEVAEQIRQLPFVESVHKSEERKAIQDG